MKNDKVKSSQIMNITAEEIQNNADKIRDDIQSWGRQELVNFNRKVSDIMRKRKPALEKAGEEYGIYTALDRFHETFDSFPTATEMKHMPLNTLRKLSRKSLEFMRDDPHTPSTVKGVREMHKKAVSEIFRYVSTDEKERKIRKYLKEQGVKGVTSTNYVDKFAKAVPPQLLSNFWAAFRTVQSEGIYGNLDSGTVLKMAQDEILDYTTEGESSHDVFAILARVRERVENVVIGNRKPKSTGEFEGVTEFS